jgi:hypothetical protein
MSRTIPSTHRLLVVLALFGAAACAPIVKTTPYRSLAPKASPDDVEVYTETRPERPYEELGLIEVKSPVTGALSSNGRLVVEARTRAARMGADAIIVTSRPIKSTVTNRIVTNRRRGRDVRYETNTVERARIQVVAVVWKEPR